MQDTDLTKLEGHELAALTNRIRGKMLKGIISYDEAKVEAKPVIDEMNARAKVVAKKYNQRAPVFTFASIMR